MKHADELGRWLEEIFASIDAGDADAFVNFLSPDGTFRFGSGPAARGQQAVREAVAGFFATIDGCRHVLHRTWQDDDTVVCEGEVTYRRHDGSEITLPFCNVLALADGMIERYSVYADVAPLYATA
ncbi:MAG TPA: nuclear transport factor 2 family protein [Woeseiaceae bacterium]|nr:nuclear transport factor 2 family protein [Woeseiaceae bacterium]